MIPGRGLTVMVNGDVDGGAPSDLSAGGQRLSERSEGCGVVAAGAADPQGVAGRALAQDRHAGGDERHSLFGPAGKVISQSSHYSLDAESSCRKASLLRRA